MQAGIPISTLSLRKNHTPAALARQVQIDIATLGSHRGSFGSFADLSGLFLAWFRARRVILPSVPKPQAFEPARI